jgi:TolA-binding protein
MYSSSNVRQVVLATPVFFFLLAGCITPAEEQQMKDDIFSLQSRIMQLEGSNLNLGKEITNQASRQEASLTSRLDKFALEIQRLKGDIDALKVGVTTGQLPGSDPDQEGSVAKTLADMTARLDALEENQGKILSAIDKAIEAKKPEKGAAKDKKEKKAPTIKTLNDIKEAFERKKFKILAEEGPKALEGIKNKKEKNEATFMVAEGLFKSGQTREAALKFNEYIESKPKEHLAHSLLRMGDCFKELDDVETARIYYQELIQKFSGSEEAKQAKNKLSKL